MSITTTTRVAGPFDGNGIATSFPFAFKAFQASDLYVERTSSTGVTVVLTLGTDYTVSLNANQDDTPGGSVVLASALATGYKLAVTTAIPELQPVVLTNLGAFFPSVVNKALDRLTILIQQIKNRVGRSLAAPVSDPTNVSLTLPSASARAGMLLAFDASGSPYAYPTSAPIAAPYAAYTVTQIVTATEGQTAFTLSGTYTQGNGSLSVYRNGQRMEVGADYVETDTTHITFATGLNVNDRVMLVRGIEVTAGAQGPMGPQGPAGPTGATGATGPQGPAGSGSGTVTSVQVAVPSELTVSGGPITASGTITLGYTAGYSIPSTANQSNWSTAYGWGNHASAGYATLTGAQTLTNKTLTAPVISTISNTGTITLPTATDTLVGRATTDTLSNKTLSAPVITGYTETRFTANTSTAYTIALSNGTVQDLTLTGNCTYTFPTPASGLGFVLLQRQDATGSRTVTWPATVKWPGSTAPTITATASKLDKFVFVSDGTYWYGSNAGQLYL